MGQSQSCTSSQTENLSTQTGPSFMCYSGVCCVPDVATYDDIEDHCNLGLYGNVTYTGFNVGAPFATGSAILPHSGSHFARGSAAKTAASGILPTLNGTYPVYDNGEFAYFRADSMWFACATAGSVDFGTQEAIDCTVTATDYGSFNDPIAVTFNYTANPDSEGRANMTNVNLAILFELTYFGSFTLDARDSAGNAVDIFIDDVVYYHLTNNYLC